MKHHYPFILLLLVLISAAQDTTSDLEIQVQAAHQVAFPTEEGKFYQLHTATSLDSEDWVPIGAPIIGDGEPYSLTQTAEGEVRRFYKAEELNEQWVLVWSDEFGGTSLDYTKWGKEENNYGGGNNEAQYYSTAEKYVSVADGYLNISVYKDSHTSVDGKTSSYTSGRIRSLQRGDWTYGRYEVRAKVPGGEGIWPAVWMLPSDGTIYGTWASGGEIDILESKGSDVTRTIGSIHFGGAWPANQYRSGSYTLPSGTFSSQFVTYAVEWHEDRIDWFVNDTRYQSITKEQWNSAAAPDSDTAPFDQPFHLIMNVAVNGGFFNGTTQDANNLPDTAFPQTLQVDYVRVYQWAE